MARKPRKAVKMQESEDLTFSRETFALFHQEQEVIKAVLARGDSLGVRLDRTKAMRLIIRSCDVNNISKTAFEEVDREISDRRRKLKSGQ